MINARVEYLFAFQFWYCERCAKSRWEWGVIGWDRKSYLRSAKIAYFNLRRGICKLLREASRYSDLIQFRNVFQTDSSLFWLSKFKSICLYLSNTVLNERCSGVTGEIFDHFLIYNTFHSTWWYVATNRQKYYQ